MCIRDSADLPCHQIRMTPVIRRGIGTMPIPGNQAGTLVGNLMAYDSHMLVTRRPRLYAPRCPCRAARWIPRIDLQKNLAGECTKYLPSSEKRRAGCCAAECTGFPGIAQIWKPDAWLSSGGGPPDDSPGISLPECAPHPRQTPRLPWSEGGQGPPPGQMFVVA